MSNSQSASGGVGPTVEPAVTPEPEQESTAEGPDREAVLSVLSDEYARDILGALGEQPLCARELVQRLDASRPTVYRRLDSLESAGVVESAMAVHPEGHHRKEFRVAVDNLQLSFGADGLTLEVTA